jgi:uncharacterized membrane protein
VNVRDIHIWAAMTLAPFLAAPLLVQAHAIAALAALIVGLVQFAGVKGTRAHRVLVPVVLVLLPLAVLAARRHQALRHRNAMLGLFLGALVVTGAFTLLPARLMGRVVFGG